MQSNDAANLPTDDPMIVDDSDIEMGEVGEEEEPMEVDN
jgi:hypothetical protein